MTVVSDTSPFNYLVLIGSVDVLPALFGRVIVPPAIMQELQHPSAPALVRAWAATPPAWLEVRQPAAIESLPGLGPGESEAISLAVELAVDQLLVDDLQARHAAVAKGLNVAGTLATIIAAANHNLLNLAQAVTRLQTTNFRASAAVWQAVLGQLPPSP